MRLKRVGLITPPLPLYTPSHPRGVNVFDKLIALEVNPGLGEHAPPQALHRRP